MKLILVAICVIVLVELANTKPCAGPRCKRMNWGPYGDDDFDTEANDGDANVEENNGYGGPTHGITNENTPKRGRAKYSGYNDGNFYGGPTNGIKNEYNPKRLSIAYNIGNDLKNRNTVHIDRI